MFVKYRNLTQLWGIRVSTQDSAMPKLSWSWSSNTLATWCKELTHWKRPWCWKTLKAGGEGDNRGWDCWMASPTWWTWVWASSGSWWWTGKSAMSVQLNWTELKPRFSGIRGYPAEGENKEMWVLQTGETCKKTPKQNMETRRSR